jgi:hypothetical protein
VRQRIAAISILCICLLSGLARGQVSTRRGSTMPVDSATAQLLFTMMATDLRNLSTAQEVYFSDHARYGMRLGVSGDTSRVQMDPSPGVTVTLTYSTRNSWTARAVHDWLPGRSCVIAVGAIPPSRTLRTTKDGRTPTQEAHATCDAP